MSPHANEGGRPRSGFVRKRWRKREQQFTYGIQVMFQGERYWVGLGTETEGWNDKRAALECDAITAQIAAGIWEPPIPQIEIEVGPDPTFHEFSSWWLEDRRPDLSPAAYDDYRNLLINHLLPFFKDYPLSAITFELVSRYRRERVAEGKRRAAARDGGVILRDADMRPLRRIGARQINASIALLKRILRRAVRSNEVALKVAPDLDHDLRVKAAPRAARRHLEADEVLTVLEAASALDAGLQPGSSARVVEVKRLRDQEHLPWSDVAAAIDREVPTAIYLYNRELRADGPHRALLAVLFCSGLRNAEASGLRRRHLDFTHDRIVIPEAKTAQGVREVWISPFLRDALRAYLATVDLKPDDLLFTTRNGRQRTRQNVANNILRPVVAEANEFHAGREEMALPSSITPHTLRRTYVTLCVQAGWSIGFVVKQVGHTDANTTNRFYLQASTGERDPKLVEVARRLVGSPG